MAYSYSELAGLRVPDAASADDVAEHFSFLTEQIDPKLVGDASSVSERDSKFFDAPAGYICRVNDSVSGELVGVYLKTTTPGLIGWHTMYETGLTMSTMPLSMTEGYEQRGTSYTPTIVRENDDWATLEGAIVRQDATPITGNGSSLMAFLPQDFAVPVRQDQDFPIATTYNSSSSAGSSKVSINNLGLTYWGPALNWIGLDGIRFRIV